MSESPSIDVVAIRAQVRAPDGSITEVWVPFARLLKLIGADVDQNLAEAIEHVIAAKNSDEEN